MSQFRKIDYGRMLYETLGNYFSVNSNNVMSFLYKYCLCLIYKLQLSFNSFDIWRKREYLIAICDWQIGQVANLLNYLYPSSGQIYITQAITANTFETTFNYDPVIFDPVFSADPINYDVTFNDTSTVRALVTFHLPQEIYNDNAKKAQLTSDINRIIFDGINYNIVSQ